MATTYPEPASLTPSEHGVQLRRAVIASTICLTPLCLTSILTQP